MCLQSSVKARRELCNALKGVSRVTPLLGRWNPGGVRGAIDVYRNSREFQKGKSGPFQSWNRGKSAPMGQSQEAIRFQGSFRPYRTVPATKVPFSEVAPGGSHFYFPATKVPFSEVKEETGERGVVVRGCDAQPGEPAPGAADGAAARPGGRPGQDGGGGGPESQLQDPGGRHRVGQVDPQAVRRPGTAAVGQGSRGLGGAQGAGADAGGAHGGGGGGPERLPRRAPGRYRSRGQAPQGGSRAEEEGGRGPVGGAGVAPARAGSGIVRRRREQAAGGESGLRPAAAPRAGDRGAGTR